MSTEALESHSKPVRLCKVQTIEFDLTFARFVPNPSEGVGL